MKTLFKESIYEILKLFYNHKNRLFHLREIARRVKLNESTTAARLSQLEKAGVLRSEKEANLKKFSIKQKIIPKIFPIFDEERIETLPLLRKNAIREYIKALKEKPVLIIIFGSTAKGIYKDDSDIDLLEIFSTKKSTIEAKKHAEAITGIKIQRVQMTEEEFYGELKNKEDKVIQSGISTGFPAFNSRYFYELIYYE